MLPRVLAIAIVAHCVSSVASAGVISADHPVFGVGALTRDTDQGLDFLDVPLSLNRTFNDVSGQFAVGGDFAGFRYATEAEVITLINNFGFSPTAVAGLFVASADPDQDQLSGLVDLLGVTFNTPGGGRLSIGSTSTPIGADRRVISVIDSVSGVDFDAINATATLSPTIAINVQGSFLVQPVPEPVPEPGSLTLFAISAGMVGCAWLRRRRNQTLSSH